MLGHRIKAIERSIVDQGNWERAQYLELIEPEGATLLEHGERAMISKEAAFERRMEKGWSKAQTHSDPPSTPALPDWGKGGKGKMDSQQVTNPFQPKGKGKGKGQTKSKWRPY